MEFDWKKLIAGVAPVIGTALGTPLAGIAVAQISNAIFGRSDATQDEIGTAIATGALTGENLVALKTAEHNFKLEMERLGINLRELELKTEEAYLRDMQDARARQVSTRDWMPQAIFFILLAVYVLEVAMFYFGKMPEDEFVRALMTRAFATVEIGLAGAIAYFIGSSRGSKQSGDAVRKIAEQAQR